LGEFYTKVQDWGRNPVRGALATASPDWENGFPTENRRHLWCHAGREDCFLNPFVHRRRAVTHPEPTKVFLNRARDGHAVCTLQVHPPTSLIPGRFFTLLRKKYPFGRMKSLAMRDYPPPLIPPFYAEAEPRDGRYDITIIDTTNTDTSSCSIDTWFHAIPIQYLAQHT